MATPRAAAHSLVRSIAHGRGLVSALDARVGELRAPDRAVRPLDLDPRGAGGVRALHHRAGDLQVGDVGAEQYARAGLDVGADPDDQIGETLKTIVVSHDWHVRTWADVTRRHPGQPGDLNQTGRSGLGLG